MAGRSVGVGAGHRGPRYVRPGPAGMRRTHACQARRCRQHAPTTYPPTHPPTVAPRADAVCLINHQPGQQAVVVQLAAVGAHTGRGWMAEWMAEWQCGLGGMQAQCGRLAPPALSNDSSRDLWA